MEDVGPRRLFVGGLFEGITEKDLRDRFQKFATIDSVDIRYRRDDTGKVIKAFAYLDTKMSEKNFKQCMATFNKTKWKGTEVQIQIAKESFMDKLKREREQKDTPAPQKETLEKKPVELCVKGAVPGTQVEGKENWVVGKYGRALPVVRLRTMNMKKVVKVDPSKYVHAVKKFDHNKKGEAKPDGPEPSVNKITWQMEVEETDTLKKIKGEFPRSPKRKTPIKKTPSKSESESDSDAPPKKVQMLYNSDSDSDSGTNSKRVSIKIGKSVNGSAGVDVENKVIVTLGKRKRTLSGTSTPQRNSVAGHVSPNVSIIEPQKSKAAEMLECIRKTAQDAQMKKSPKTVVKEKAMNKATKKNAIKKRKNESDSSSDSSSTESDSESFEHAKENLQKKKKKPASSPHSASPGNINLKNNPKEDQPESAAFVTKVYDSSSSEEETIKSVIDSVKKDFKKVVSPASRSKIDQSTAQNTVKIVAAEEKVTPVNSRSGRKNQSKALVKAKDVKYIQFDEDIGGTSDEDSDDSRGRKVGKQRPPSNPNFVPSPKVPQFAQVGTMDEFGVGVLVDESSRGTTDKELRHGQYQLGGYSSDEDLLDAVSAGRTAKLDRLSKFANQRAKFQSAPEYQENRKPNSRVYNSDSDGSDNEMFSRISVAPKNVMKKIPSPKVQPSKDKKLNTPTTNAKVKPKNKKEGNTPGGKTKNEESKSSPVSSQKKKLVPEKSVNEKDETSSTSSESSSDESGSSDEESTQPKSGNKHNEEVKNVKSKPQKCLSTIEKKRSVQQITTTQHNGSVEESDSEFSEEDSEDEVETMKVEAKLGNGRVRNSKPRSSESSDESDEASDSEGKKRSTKDQKALEGEDDQTDTSDESEESDSESSGEQDTKKEKQTVKAKGEKVTASETDTSDSNESSESSSEDAGITSGTPVKSGVLGDKSLTSGNKVKANGISAHSKVAPKVASSSSDSSSEDEASSKVDDKNTSIKQTAKEFAKSVGLTQNAKDIGKTANNTKKTQSDNAKRLETLKQRTKETQNQKKLIQKALSSIDSSSPSTKIVFNSDSEDEIQKKSHAKEKPVPLPYRKDSSSETSEEEDSSDSSESEGEESSRPAKRKDVKETVKGPTLFEDSGESSENDEDEDRFKIKPQFEGPAGAKLMSLQTRFASDPRFKMSEMFLENEDAGMENHEVGAFVGKSSNDNEEEDMDTSKERDRALEILKNVVGNTAHKTERKNKMKTFRDIGSLRYDPTMEDHEHFEVKAEEKPKSAKKKKKKVVEEPPQEAESVPEVSGDRFFEVQKNLKDAFSTSEQPFSLLAMLGREADEPAVSQLQQEDGKGKALESTKMPWQDPFALDVSDDDENVDKAKDVKKSGEKVNAATSKSENKILLKCLFFKESDARIQEGIEFFRQPDDMEKVREMWAEGRSDLVEAYRQKRKRIRFMKQNSISLRGGRPGVRGRGGKFGANRGRR